MQRLQLTRPSSGRERKALAMRCKMDDIQRVAFAKWMLCNMNQKSP